MNRRTVSLALVLIVLLAAALAVWLGARPPAEPTLDEIRAIPPGTLITEVQKKLGAPSRIVHGPAVDRGDMEADRLFIWTRPGNAVSVYVDQADRVVRVKITGE